MCVIISSFLKIDDSVWGLTVLRSIRIRDFRSITDLTLNVKQLNIMVGRNDTGKSNILRALNLFFNNETDFRKPFDFSQDYSIKSKKRQGKASEIRIDLTLDIPAGYKFPEGARYIKWSRRWRKEGKLEESPREFLSSPPKKNLITPRSNINRYLNSIDYHYIPALKGKDFFAELLGEIYDVLSGVSAEQLKKASGPLQETLEDILGEVAKEVTSILRGPSEPKLPENLRSVFRLVQFEANGIDLDRRGDGIRVRHVPSLVKFLCDLKSRRAGKYKSFHLWGLEEPENSVDFIAAFEMRDQILDISRSQQHQILMATHSPIFFSLENEKDVATNFFIQEDAETKLAAGAGDVSDEMGVLRVVSPYVEKSRAEIEQIKETLSSLNKKLEGEVLDPSRRMVFVEGQSDASVLSEVNSVLGVVKDVRFVPGIGGSNSSANSVADNAIAWHFLQKNRPQDKRVRGVGLVDNDDAGDAAIRKFTERLTGENNLHSRIEKLRPSKTLVVAYKSRGFEPRVALEALFPSELWAIAEEQGWLVRRTNPEVFKRCSTSKKDEILSAGIGSLASDADTMAVFYDVKIENKGDFAKLFLESLKSKPEIAEPFKVTLTEIRAVLSKGTL